MKLSTVISCVNNNPNYYLFIPKQIIFWKKFGIKFIAIYVADSIPEEIIKYSENIILWNKNLDINTSFVAQNLRIYYPALLNLPDDEMVMITDMDMLPMSSSYYCDGLEKFTKDDFIYYRHIDGNQIYMCYNASHPSTWKKVFNINNEEDIIHTIYKSFNKSYDGIPGSTGWFTDQEIMFKNLINYPQLKVLKRPIRRLEVYMFEKHISNNDINFIKNYDDAHFHRNYKNNEHLILNSEKQLDIIKMKKVITFSLWGDNPTYNIGAIQNAIDANIFYPDFECWFYIHVNSVPKKTIEELNKFENCKIIYKHGDIINENCKPRMWRFEAIDDPDVEIMMSRDSDTRIREREFLAVDEWLKSGKTFHIMRDHPHHDFCILAGMFGTKKIPQIPSWKNIMNNYIKTDNRMYDQNFLKGFIYPLIINKSIIHATFHKYEKHAINFPIKYCNELKFVGEYVYHDESRSQEHIDILRYHII